MLLALFMDLLTGQEHHLRSDQFACVCVVFALSSTHINLEERACICVSVHVVIH